MVYSHIDHVLKAYFAYMSQQGPYLMASFADVIPGPMLDTNRFLKDDSEFLVWKPIPSTFTDQDINELEAVYSHPVPASYRYFLKQLHFVELYLNQGQLAFFPSFPDQLASGFKEIIDGYYDDLPKRGYLPFANFGDWGVACFDTNLKVVDNEWPVVVFDHEDGYTDPMPYTNNFEEVFERAAHGFVWLGTMGWQIDNDNVNYLADGHEGPYL